MSQFHTPALIMQKMRNFDGWHKIYTTVGHDKLTSAKKDQFISPGLQFLLNPISNYAQVTPDKIEIPIPAYFKRDRTESLAYWDNLLKVTNHHYHQRFCDFCVQCQRHFHINLCLSGFCNRFSCYSKFPHHFVFRSVLYEL